MKKSVFAGALLVCTVAPHLGSAQTEIDLNGVWAHRVVTTSISKLPVLGRMTNESRFFALARIQHEGDVVNMSIEPCWVRIVGEMKRVKTIVPNAAVAIMGPRTRTGHITGDDVTIDRAVDVIGANLVNEWTDPLTDSVDHPSQWDEDGDGKPGVTIRIIGPVDGEVYVAQRTWNSLSGKVSADGESIRGLVDWSTEQQVLDGSSMFLRANPSSTPHPNKRKSNFLTRRMPATTTCADIKRQNDALFTGLK